jgi:putative phosphotransacetylase
MSSIPACGCAKHFDYSDEKIVDLIVSEVQNILQSKSGSLKNYPKSNSRYPLIPVGVSNRHIHLTLETFHRLFGENINFESMRPLFKEGEFASRHLVTIIGPKMRSISNVRVLGPLRKYDQVEVSLTDAFFLGIDPPVANSGDLNNAASLTLAGPNSSVFIEKCGIVANRHIHMSDKEAGTFGLKNGDLCKVRIAGEKSTIFENVLVRTKDNWRLQIHIDTDDANAANIRNEAYAEFEGKM